MNEILIELEALEVLKQASKARAMIYDIDTKEKVAWIKGIAKDTYYLMNYYDWIEIRNSTSSSPRRAP